MKLVAYRYELLSCSYPYHIYLINSKDTLATNMKLLLVEDYEQTIEVISLYCNSKGNIDFRVLNNGKEGLEAIQKDNFDLILLDLAMP